MIEHTVTFSLVHRSGSSEESDFLEAARELAKIPEVSDFRICRQVSTAHPHRFGIAMRPASQEDYDSYKAHPLHHSFVQDRRVPEVSDFQEADFVEL